MLKVDGKHPCDLSPKDKSHRNSLRLTSWNQPSSDPEIEDLFTDSHPQVNWFNKIVFMTCTSDLITNV